MVLWAVASSGSLKSSSRLTHVLESFFSSQNRLSEVLSTCITLVASKQGREDYMSRFCFFCPIIQKKGVIFCGTLTSPLLKIVAQSISGLSRMISKSRARLHIFCVCVSFQKYDLSTWWSLLCWLLSAMELNSRHLINDQDSKIIYCRSSA